MKVTHTRVIGHSVKVYVITLNALKCQEYTWKCYYVYFSTFILLIILSLSN